MLSKTATYMTMLCTVTVADKISQTEFDQVVAKVFEFYQYVDDTFSPFKPDSEVGLINLGKLKLKDASLSVLGVLTLCEQTKLQTNGYFDIKKGDKIDPCGLVKGWAINSAAKKLKVMGFKNFMVEIAGDIEVSGLPEKGKLWKLGIQNPFNLSQIIKVVGLSNQGIATSGTYQNGAHIYDPVTKKPLNEIISLSVIGKNVYEADRFATAAFAMGKSGIKFIEGQPDLEAYMIDLNGIATYTSGFDKYLIKGN